MQDKTELSQESNPDLPGDFYFAFLSGLTKGKVMQSIIFVIIIFLIFIKDRIKNLEIKKTTLKN